MSDEEVNGAGASLVGSHVRIGAASGGMMKRTMAAQWRRDGAVGWPTPKPWGRKRP